MPTAQTEPAGAASIVLMMNSVEPTRSARCDDLVGALRVDDHLDAGPLRTELVDDVGGEPAVHGAVALPQDHPRGRERLRGDAATGLPGVPHDAVVETHPELEHGGVAAEVLVGQEQDLRVRLLVEPPLQGDVGVARRTDRAAVAAAERLDVGRGVHVGDGDDVLRDPGIGQGVPAVLDLREPGHVGHRAAGREVGQHDDLVGRGQDVGRLGHEVDAAEDDELRLGPTGRIAGQLERVAGDVGELDDLVALVVVSQDEHPLAERRFRRPGALDQVGIGRRRQVARALDAALGGQVGAAPERQQGQVHRRHGAIVETGAMRAAGGSTRLTSGRRARCRAAAGACSAAPDSPPGTGPAAPPSRRRRPSCSRA